MQRFTCFAILLLISGECLFSQDIQVGRAPRRTLKRKATVANDGTGTYTSIQAAIDAAEFNATITIKEGIYRETVLLKSFVNLRGEGEGKTILISGDDGPVVEAYNLGGGMISDLTLKGRTNDRGPLLIGKYANFSVERCSFVGGVTGAEILHKSLVNFRDCSFSTFVQEAIRYADRSHGYVINCTVSDAEIGIIVDQHASPTVERNTISTIRRHGIWVRNNSTNKILGNVLTGIGDNGILVESNSSPLIRNNTVHGNGRAGVGKATESSGYGVLLKNTSAVSLVNNSITSNSAGLGLFNAREIVFSRNNVWGNDTNYVGIAKPDSDLSVNPDYQESDRLLFKITSSSPLYRMGEDAVSIGADFDNTRLERKRRLNYLKTAATRDLSLGNYYTAYQSAEEILQIDREDIEGQSLKRKAGSEIGKAYVRNAIIDFEAQNLRIAENYLRAALTYDPDNQEAKNLRSQIEDLYAADRWRVTFYVIGGFLVVGFGGWYWKKRILLSELKRQVKWWLDDATEQMEIAKSIRGERFDPEGMILAQKKLKEAQQLFEQGNFEASEHACNESARFSARVKDETEKQRRIRQDAMLEVGNAEELMNSICTEIADRFVDDVKELEFYLDRAREAIRSGQFLLAKELSEDLQSTIRHLEDRLEDERLRNIRELIADTESLIVGALATNDSPEIISAVIDFRSELDTLRSGFENGQVSADEVLPQIRQINDFVLEVQKLGGGDGKSPSAKKRSFYDILGVKEDASLEQIKAVYRKLSMIYHPDMNASDDLGIAGDERFKEIKEAYDILVSQKTQSSGR
ncbi:MAG: DnaJ domain-containing protein [Bacteroidetes bacterium]|nr:DnaJ domain-containing protein [Bacteroidota bacterium]